MDANTHRNEAIRGAFMAGFSSANVRQRLLENEQTDLDSLVQLARSLEIASVNASKFLTHTGTGSCSTLSSNLDHSSDPVACNIKAALVFDAPTINSVSTSQESNFNSTKEFANYVKRKPASYSKPNSHSCSYCGYDYHTRSMCPARNATCFKCNSKGHFGRVCRKSQNQSISAAAFSVATAEPSKFCCSVDGDSGLQKC